MYQGARSTGPPDCPHARNAAQRRKVVLYAPVSLLSKRHGAGRIPISRQTHIHALHTRTPPVRYDDRPPMSRASMRRQSRPAKTKAAPRERNAPTAEVRPTPRCACTRRRKRYASDRHREANRSIPCLVAHSATRQGAMAAPTPKHERMAPSVRCPIPVRRWASRNPPPSSPMSQIRRWPSGPGSTSRMACQHFSQAAAPPLTRATARRIRACDFKTCARER